MDRKDLVIALSGACILGLLYRNGRLIEQNRKLVKIGNKLCESLEEYVQRDVDAVFEDIVQNYD